MLACTSPCKPLPRDTGGVGGPEAGTWRAFPGCSLGTHVDVGTFVIGSLFTHLSLGVTVVLLNFVCIRLDVNLLRVGSLAYV